MKIRILKILSLCALVFLFACQAPVPRAAVQVVDELALSGSKSFQLRLLRGDGQFQHNADDVMPLLQEMLVARGWKYEATSPELLVEYQLEFENEPGVAMQDLHTRVGQVSMYQMKNTRTVMIAVRIHKNGHQGSLYTAAASSDLDDGELNDAVWKELLARLMSGLPES